VAEVRGGGKTTGFLSFVEKKGKRQGGRRPRPDEVKVNPEPLKLALVARWEEGGTPDHFLGQNWGGVAKRKNRRSWEKEKTINQPKKKEGRCGGCRNSEIEKKRGRRVGRNRASVKGAKHRKTKPPKSGGRDWKRNQKPSKGGGKGVCLADKKKRERKISGEKRITEKPWGGRGGAHSRV